MLWFAYTSASVVMLEVSTMFNTHGTCEVHQERTTISNTCVVLDVQHETMRTFAPIVVLIFCITALVHAFGPVDAKWSADTLVHALIYDSVEDVPIAVSDAFVTVYVQRMLIAFNNATSLRCIQYVAIAISDAIVARNAQRVTRLANTDAIVIVFVSTTLWHALGPCDVHVILTTVVNAAVTCEVKQVTSVAHAVPAYRGSVFATFRDASVTVNVQETLVVPLVLTHAGRTVGV